jgi:hypothetical protein
MTIGSWRKTVANCSGYLHFDTQTIVARVFN